MCHHSFAHLPLSHPTTTFVILLLVGAAIGWQENHYYAHACALSTTRLLGCGWYVHYEDPESVHFPSH